MIDTVGVVRNGTIINFIDNYIDGLQQEQKT